MSAKSSYLQIVSKMILLGGDLGKIRRGGYLFITWIGDHPPRHVHIYKDDKLIVKYNLEANVVIDGKLNRKLKKILTLLIVEGRL